MIDMRKYSLSLTQMCLFYFFCIDTDFDLVTTTLSPIIANICRNQTISSSDEIENRINVVVPYLVILGK
jgi:hypothetical protein